LERLARFNRQFVDFFICGNADGKQILIERGVPVDKIEVLPQFGIDADIFYPYSAERRENLRSELGISPSEFVVGFVGRFVEEKGLSDLVEAICRLRAASDRIPVLLLNGKGNMEDAARERCGQLGVKLLVVPPRRYHQIADTMNVLDVLVLPSRSRRFWKEQFGHVLIEAMASGVPVIGSDSGEIPNVIGNAGLVFPEGKPEKLFQCLQLCSGSEDFRLALRDRGLERVSKNYTNEIVADATLKIYTRIALSNHARYTESSKHRIPK
jgi:glycosyltransferase involved in cell wall biosynthesis